MKALPKFICVKWEQDCGGDLWLFAKPNRNVRELLERDEKAIIGTYQLIETFQGQLNFQSNSHKKVK